eukprot:gene17601-15860_t
MAMGVRCATTWSVDGAGGGGTPKRRRTHAEDEPAVSRLRGPHPYGVQPEGNLLAGGATPSCRELGLGTMAALPDPLLLNILAQLDPKPLCRFLQASKATYVLGHFAELWRQLVLTTTDAVTAGFWFNGSWKDTLAGITAKDNNIKPHSPIVVKGFYSDVLFAPWICAASSTDPSWVDIDNIERRSAETMSADDFRQEFELPNKPVIITDLASKWPAALKWNVDYLAEQSGDTTFEATPGPIQISMRQYW